MSDKIVTDQEIVQLDLAIDNANMFELEIACKKFPQLLEKYTRMSAQSIKEVDRINMELEVVTAELADDLCKLYEAKEGKSYPASGIQEIRRSFVPLCREWKLKKVELYKATETMNILKGTVKAIESKGFKMKELFEVELKRLYGEKSSGYDNS